MKHARENAETQPAAQPPARSPARSPAQSPARPLSKIHGPAGANPRSILVVLPTWVGDCVMATPTLRAIRTRFQEAHITFLIEANLRELVAGGTWMDECVSWPEKRKRSLLHKEYRDLIWDLRRRRFDWAVLLPNSFRSALAARLMGATRRIGYDRDRRGFLLTDRIKPTKRRTDESPEYPNASPSKSPVHRAISRRALDPFPIVEYYADLAETLDCPRPDDRLELFETPACSEAVEKRLTALGISEHRPLVIVCPGAQFGAAKCWLPERFAAVADRLIETENAAVVITCGPGEQEIAMKIAAAMKRGGHVMVDPLLSLGELKSLIRRSHLLIGNDAGPRHIGKAFQIPVVTIFGPTHPGWTTTSYEAERIVRIDIECGPCQQRVCPLGHLDCMAGVSVESVTAAAKELLASKITGGEESRGAAAPKRQEV